MSRRLWILFFAGFLSCGASTPDFAGQEPSPCKPEVWRGAMTEFEKQDAQKPAPQDVVVFVGSSSIRMWDLDKWFPDLPTLNRGFGGSQICDVAHFADVLATKHKPRAIVFYSGDNDVAAGKTAEQVHADFCEFMKKVRVALPETPVVFILIKPSIARWKFRDVQREANRLIANERRRDKHLAIVDVWPAMLGDDGQPRKDIFLEDGLHMNDAGYKIWSDLVRPHLDQEIGQSRKREHAKPRKLEAADERG
jgi:lysophospholipase L1-like esterase